MKEVKKNTLNLAFWTTAWVVTMAFATFGPKFIWDSNTNYSIVFILLNTAIGVGMILSNVRYIKGMDELQRKIQLESMAIALGVGVIGGLSYSMLDTTDVISFDAEISHLVIGISLSYMAGLFIGKTRFK